MKVWQRARFWRTGLLVAWLCGGLAAGMGAAPELDAQPKDKASPKDDKLPRPRPVDDDNRKSKPPPKEGEIEALLPPVPPSILPQDANGVDLACVLRLAGVNNPDILIARHQVAVAEGMRMFAYAQVLPNLNAGINYDTHTGTAATVQRQHPQSQPQALYVGAGAGADRGGHRGHPRRPVQHQLSAGLFAAWPSVRKSASASSTAWPCATRSSFAWPPRYMDLLRAEGQRAIAVQNRDDAHEIALLTAAMPGRERASSPMPIAPPPNWPGASRG